MRLYFHGAAESVTGANYLIECAGKKVLIDCGLNQGGRFAEKLNYEPFPYNPAEIEAIFITHAHIDHVGRVPKLFRDGFKGKIIATHPTLDLARLALDDSVHILAEESEHFKEEPLFTEEDVMNTWKLTHGVAYRKEIKINSNITAKFYDAGHILGSAIIELILREGAKRIKIIFSGDLGNPPVPLLQSTEYIENTDYVLIESAYGDKIHEDKLQRKEKLKTVIESTIKHGGVLMIPAFALERTQELLFEINNLAESGQIPKIPVFLDSPLAIKATAVYQKYSDYFNKEAVYLIATGDDLFNFPGLEFSLTTQSSKAINGIMPPKIIIAGSGMSEGGRILHHEKIYLPDPKAVLLIIGYQPQGTLGRALLDGAQEVKILGEKILVRAQIKAIGGYSAHADQIGLINWLQHIKPPIKKVFVVQGEADPASILALKINNELSLSAEVPQIGQVVELT